MDPRTARLPVLSSSVHLDALRLLYFAVFDAILEVAGIARGWSLSLHPLIYCSRPYLAQNRAPAFFTPIFTATLEILGWTEYHI